MLKCQTPNWQLRVLNCHSRRVWMFIAVEDLLNATMADTINEFIANLPKLVKTYFSGKHLYFFMKINICLILLRMVPFLWLGASCTLKWFTVEWSVGQAKPFKKWLVCSEYRSIFLFNKIGSSYRVRLYDMSHNSKLSH